MNASNSKSGNILADQITAGYVLQELNDKHNEFIHKVNEIGQETTQKIQDNYTALNDALKTVERVRDYASPQNLNHVLGSEATKHGEIAEHVEVEITNGRKILDGLKSIADIDSVGRTAPEDYIINGDPVQSKFIAGFNKTLDHVLDHIHKYPNFAKDAAEYGYPGHQGYYHIPKDQYDTIHKILSGETTEFNSKTIRACQSIVKQIEEATGRNFSDVVRPSISNYHDVQLGTIDKTLDRYNDEFYKKSEDNIDTIRKEQSEKLENANHIEDPSWGDAAKAAGVGAVVGGVLSAGISLWKKLRYVDKNGNKVRRNLSDLSTQDWKDIGFDFAKGGLRGGISGGAIYALTKLGGFSAPFAGAIVSTGIGIFSLAMDYRSGKISKEEFADAAAVLSVEAGMSAVGAAIGQAVIPIPVIGAVVGTVATKAALMVTKEIFGGKEKALIAKMQKEYDDLVSRLEANTRLVINQIDDYFNKFNGLIAASMHPDLNLRLNASIELCRFVGVDESEIIHNIDELDDFMLS